MLRCCWRPSPRKHARARLVEGKAQLVGPGKGWKGKPLPPFFVRYTCTTQRSAAVADPGCVPWSNGSAAVTVDTHSRTGRTEAYNLPRPLMGGGSEAVTSRKQEAERANREAAGLTPEPEPKVSALERFLSGALGR